MPKRDNLTKILEEANKSLQDIKDTCIIIDKEDFLKLLFSAWLNGRKLSSNADFDKFYDFYDKNVKGNYYGT